jgi:hypothetical protein
MITVASQTTALNYSKRLVVELDDRLRDALDEVIRHRQAQSPLLPPDQTNVVRSMIIEEYLRINHPNDLS